MTPATLEASAYEELVAAIVKAVPEIQEHDGFPLGDDFEQTICLHCSVVLRRSNKKSKCLVGRHITLEDVLMAYRKDKDLTQYLVEKWYYIDQEELLFKWHLGHTLEWHRDNAPETITFLHSLLCPKT